MKLAQQGDLPGARIGRAWVFLEDDIVEYLRVRVRQQMAARISDNVIETGLQASLEKTPPTPSPLLLKRKAQRSRTRELPELPALPEHIGQLARA